MGAVHIVSDDRLKPYDVDKKLIDQVKAGDIIKIMSTPENYEDVKTFLHQIESEKLSVLPPIGFKVNNQNTIIGANASKKLQKMAKHILLSWALFHLVHSAESIDRKFAEILNA